MKLLHRIDQAADGLLIMGALTSGIRVLKPADSRPTDRHYAVAHKAYHGLLGVATIYKLARAVGPKTKAERRMIKLSQLYNQAETYNRRARIYQRVAESFLKRRIGELKAATTA